MFTRNSVKVEESLHLGVNEQKEKCGLPSLDYIQEQDLKWQSSFMNE
jgi:hypothetical protein